MSNRTLPSPRLPLVARASTLAAIALAALGLPAPASASAQEVPEKTFSERAKEYWEKVVSSMESAAKSTGDEYHKLRDRAAQETGPAREQIAAEMEAIGKKWATVREKLTASIEAHAHATGEEIRRLEAKAAEASGPARDKMAAELEKLRDEWDHARAKMGAALSSNMKATREEFSHLKGQASEATADIRAKLAPRIDKLKAEWHANREKLAAYLEADLKRTKEDMDKIGEATSDATRAAKEKLMKKYHQLRDKSERLAEEKSLD